MKRSPAESPLRRWLEIAFLYVITVAAYWPALRATGFVWDDNAHVTRPDLRSLAGLHDIWFKLGATQQYYPMLHSAFWVESHLWADLPLGYHLLNVLLHATSAVLLVAALRKLAFPGAYIAGLLFALHPVMAESVAWVSEQKNTLSGLLYFLSALAYFRFNPPITDVRHSAPVAGAAPISAERAAGKDPVGRRRWLWYALATCCFLFALLCKTVTASLPAALLVIIWWKRGRITARRDVFPLVPWFICGAAAGLTTAWVERHYIGAIGPEFQLSLVQRCFLAGRVFWCYLAHVLWPADLMFFYRRWPWSWSPAWLIGLPAALFLIYLAWRYHARARGPLAGLLFFGGTLFPALGFFNVYPFRFSYVADHFQYLASVGILAPVAYAARRLAYPRGKAPWYMPNPAVFRTIGVALLVVLGAFTWRECLDYHDPVTFYKSILAKNPEAWIAENNLGFILHNDGHIDEALPHYEKALALNPRYSEAHSNIGVIYLAKGQFQLAIEHFKEALKFQPKFPQCHNNYGIALSRVGQLDAAVAEYREALKEAPSYGPAQTNLARILTDIGNDRYLHGKIAEAIPYFQEALKWNPNLPDAENNLGLSLARTGHIPDALPHYAAALRLKPDYADAEFNYGLACSALGRTSEAVQHFANMAKLNPKSADAFNDLGACLYKLGKYQDAKAAFESALKLQPANKSMQNNLTQAVRAIAAQSASVAHPSK